MPTTRASQRLKQTKIDFSKNPSSGDDVTEPKGKRSLRSAAHANKVKSSPLTKSKSPAISLRRTARSSPVKGRPRNSLFGAKKQRIIVLDSEDDREGSEAPKEDESQNSPVNRRPSRRVVISDSEDDDNEIKNNIHSSALQHNNKSLSSPNNSCIIPDSEDEKSTVMFARRQKLEEFSIGEPETSGDDIMRSSPTIKPRTRRTPRKQLSEDEEESDEESDEDEITRPGRSIQRKVRARSRSESPSGSDIVRSVKRQRTSPRDEADEDEELQAELQDLRESSPINTPIKSRKDKQRAGLAKLKERRERRVSGNVKLVSDDEDYDYGSQEDDYLVYEDGEEYDDDFVDDTLGAPDPDEIRAQMPAKFSNLATADLDELFSLAVEWLIQNRINPGFGRHSESYDIAWRRLDDEISGLVSSKFKSSIWKANFVICLEARPFVNFVHERADIISSDCQACGKTSHSATYTMTFDGGPYDPDSLEELVKADEDDVDVDYKGREIPEQTEFYLGKTCFDNARDTHTLHHWKYSLNKAIEELLDDRGELSAEKIVERDRMSIAKKTTYSIKLMKEWEEDGSIDEFWTMYSEFLDVARTNRASSQPREILIRANCFIRKEQCVESSDPYRVMFMKAWRIVIWTWRA
jgi:uncharacterized protein DUF4211